MNTLTGQKQWEIEATEIGQRVRTRAALERAQFQFPEPTWFTTTHR